MEQYKIYSVNGPVVKATGGRGLAMKDMVYVGSEQLIGEVVSVDGDMTTVQVYEDTAGLEPGQVVTATGAPMSLRYVAGRGEFHPGCRQIPCLYHRRSTHAVHRGV